MAIDVTETREHFPAMGVFLDRISTAPAGSSIAAYCALIVPGIVQEEPYARFQIGRWRSPEAAERAAAARRRFQTMLNDAGIHRLALVGHAALRQPLVPRGVQRGQLTALLQLCAAGGDGPRVGIVTTGPNLAVPEGLSAIATADITVVAPTEDGPTVYTNDLNHLVDGGHDTPTVRARLDRMRQLTASAVYGLAAASLIQHALSEL